MNAFDDAIERIDEIKMPEEFRPIFIEGMKRYSAFYEKNSGIELNLNELFDKFLFENVDEHDNIPKLQISIDEKMPQENWGAYYWMKDNSLHILPLTNFEHDVSTFVHEFTHFIIHNAYGKKLPVWEDEMMTEFTAREVTYSDTNKGYGYINLLFLANFINHEIDALNIVKFMNGQEQELLSKYHDSFIESDLTTIKDKFDINAMTRLVNDLIAQKGQKIKEKGVDFEEFVDSMTLALVNAPSGYLNTNVIIGNIATQLRQFPTIVVPNKKSVESDEIRKLLTLYYVQKKCEKEANEPVDFIQTIKVGDYDYITAKTTNHQFCLSSFDSYSKIHDVTFGSHEYKSGRGHKCFSFSSCRSDYALIIDGVGFIKDSKDRFLGRNVETFDCKDKNLVIKIKNFISRELDRELSEIELKNFVQDKRQFHYYNVEELNKYLDIIKNLAKNLGAQLNCTYPEVWLTGSGENDCMVFGPMYHIKGAKICPKVLNDLTAENADTLLKGTKLGAQTTIVATKPDGTTIPLACFAKECDDKLAFSINYAEVLRNTQLYKKNELMKTIMHQKEYDNILD